jgi:hypothetical protein
VTRGKYDLIECTKRYCEYLRQQLNANTEGKENKLNYETERALHEEAKREKSEMHLKVMKGELHIVKDVEYVMTDMTTKAKTKLLGLLSKAAPMVMGYKDISKIQSILQKIIDDALNELSEYSQSYLQMMK